MSRYTKANHRVFMQFVRREVWHVTFLEPGLQTPLPKKLTFKDEGKIRELARKGEAWGTSEDRQLLEYAIAKGEGGVYLRLSPEQYRKLRPSVVTSKPAIGIGLRRDCFTLRQCLSARRGLSRRSWG